MPTSMARIRVSSAMIVLTGAERPAVPPIRFSSGNKNGKQDGVAGDGKARAARLSTGFALLRCIRRRLTIQ